MQWVSANAQTLPINQYSINQQLYKYNVKGNNSCTNALAQSN